MWRSIEVGHFRGLRNVSMARLGAVNLLVGANNSGKTSLLEAIALAARPTDLRQWITVATHRDASAPVAETIWSMFPDTRALQRDDDEKTSAKFSIQVFDETVGRHIECDAIVVLGMSAGRVDGPDALNAGLEVQVGLSEGRPPLKKSHSFQALFFPSRPTGRTRRDEQEQRAVLLTPASHRSTSQLVASLSEAVDRGEKPLAVSLLQRFDPAIVDVDLSRTFGHDAIRIRHKTRGVVDLATFGDGVRRALALSLALPRAMGGVLLLDEVEANMHVRMLVDTLRWLVDEAARLSVQVFVTTHSLEAIDAFLGVFEGRDDDALVTWHLGMQKGQRTIRRLGLAELRHFRHDEGFDVR